MGLFFYGYISIQGTKDFGSVLRIGLGSVDPRTIVQSGTAASGVAGVFQNVIIANSPQVIISLIYFSYNAAITSMLLAHEWSGFFARYRVSVCRPVVRVSNAAHISSSFRTGTLYRC